MNDFYYYRQTPTGQKKSKQITASTLLILKEAEKLNIQVEKIPYTQLFKLTYKKKIRYFRYQIPHQTTNIGIYCGNNKKITKRLLEQANISVPKGYSINKKDKKEYYRQILTDLKKPIVVKPVAGSQGDYITVNINNIDSFCNAIEKAFQFQATGDKKVVIAEEMYDWPEYRILASRKKVIGIIHRIPANIIGDGEKTIEELIKIKNLDPRRSGVKNQSALYKIEIDDDLKQFLDKQNLNLHSIPKKNQQIMLRGVSNISQGGDSVDYTDIAHESVNKIALKIIKAIPGLHLAGIDFMCKNISQKQNKDSYVILEVNHSPGLDIHDYPYKGKNRHAGFEFLKIMFPELPDPYKN